MLENRDFADVIHTFKMLMPADVEKIVAYREGWNGVHQYISLQKPDKHSANTEPYIYFAVDDGLVAQRLPWVASQTDLLTGDWVILTYTQWWETRDTRAAKILSKATERLKSVLPEEVGDAPGERASDEVEAHREEEKGSDSIEDIPLEPFYISFGQGHVHSIGGRTIDKDHIVTLMAIDEGAARRAAHDLFGQKWSMLYNSEPDMTLFSGGIIQL